MATSHHTAPHVSSVYRIRNLINGKVYIGSAVNTRHRWYDHRTDLNTNKHHSRYLQRAWNKYGSSAFVFEIIRVVCKKENLVRIEQYFIDKCKSFDRRYGYNISPTAGSVLGIKRSPETVAKVAAALRNPSPETREKLSETAKRSWANPDIRAKLVEAAKNRSQEVRDRIAAPRRGKKHSAEHRAKISASQKGKPKAKGRRQSPESNARRSASLKGHTVSPATRAKLRAASLGRKHSAEAKAKMSAASKGRRISPERRVEISNLHKGNKYNLGRKQTPEQRARLSAAMKGRACTPKMLAALRATQEQQKARRNKGQMMFDFDE